MDLRALGLKLAERAGNRSERLAAIFEYTATPRQLQIMSELPQPPAPSVTTAEIAQQLGLAPETVRTDLEDLFRKGLVSLRDYSSRDGWWFAQSDIQIRDAMQCIAPQLVSDPARLHDMWREYDEKECFRPWIEGVVKDGRLNRRMIPAWPSVTDYPGLQWWEDWREIFRRKSLISVRHCPCRMEMHRCDRPLETCIKFDKWAEHDIAAGHGRRISADEATHIMDGTAKAGLIAYGTNIKNIITMCNCCSDCCFIFNAAKQNNVSYSKIWDRSRFRARIDQDKCKGCQKCIDNCNFDAITMIKVAGSKKMKAQVDPEDCFGCGCCFMVCDNDAIAMDCFRPDYTVPDALTELTKPVHGYDY